MNMDIIAIIIAITSLVLLIILGVVLYVLKIKKWKPRKKERKTYSKRKVSVKKEETYATEIVGNSRLDGARVSHRREHPDRIAQEEMFRKNKSKEEEKQMMKAEFERKNKLELVYSPCSGGIVSFAQTLEDAKSHGLHNPGVIVSPYDELISSPINGIVKEVSESNHQISIESNNGLKVELKLQGINTEAECWTQSVFGGSEVRVGDILFKIKEDIIRNEHHPITLSIILDNYKKDQLLLMKNVNYVSMGDKLITVKEGMI